MYGMHKYAEMQKLAAERQVIVEAMTKIANAHGYYLTPQVAEVIAANHQYSPVLIMKTAFDLSGALAYLANNPAALGALGAGAGGGLGAIMGGRGHRGLGALLGAAGGGAAGYFGAPYMQDMMGLGGESAMSPRIPRGMPLPSPSLSGMHSNMGTDISALLQPSMAPPPDISSGLRLGGSITPPMSPMSGISPLMY